MICSGAQKTASGVFALDFARYDKLSVSLCHFDRSGEYAVRGRWRMDCIARFGNGRASRESASQISHFFPSRLGPNSKRCLHFGRHDKNNTRVAKPRQRVGVSNAPRRLLPRMRASTSLFLRDSAMPGSFAWPNLFSSYLWLDRFATQHQRILR